MIEGAINVPTGIHVQVGGGVVQCVLLLAVLTRVKIIISFPELEITAGQWPSKSGHPNYLYVREKLNFDWTVHEEKIISLLVRRRHKKLSLFAEGQTQFCFLFYMLFFIWGE